MKIFEKLGLSESETKLVKKVLIFSTVATIAVVAGLWIFQTIGQKQNTPKTHLHTVDPTKVSELDIDANLEVAIRRMQSNDCERAIPHLQRVVELRKDDPATRSLLADAYLESGEYEFAISEYDYLLQKTLPDSLSGRICARRAICQFYNKEKTSSLEALKKCTELFPNSAEGFCFLGQIEASQELPSPTALIDLNRAIALDSNYVEAWYQLARYYMELKEYSRARPLLLRAIDINPLHEKSQSRLGMVYYYLNNFDLAKKAYQTALAINPTDFNTHYNLGEVYYAVGDTSKAMNEFNKTLEYNPGHTEANFKQAILLLSNNMIKEAIIHFERAVHNGGYNSRILIQLAIAYEKLGDKEKAISTYRSVLEKDALNVIAQQKIKLMTE
jgi:tetratricopeptide (TPR) repeat protein